MTSRLISVGRRKLVCGILPAWLVWCARRPPRRTPGKRCRNERRSNHDSPKDIPMCATCTLFEPPKCKVVEDDVSPSGWCKAFALAD
jgi:hypothetical protein